MKALGGRFRFVPGIGERRQRLGGGVRFVPMMQKEEEGLEVGSGLFR
jgi:hypothetical protein